MTAHALPATEVARIEQWAALVHTRAGRVAHVLPHLRSVFPVYPAALCGRTTGWGEDWWGTGSQRETDHVHTLPVCGRCADLAKERNA